jgi:uncharacterized protein YdeI (YjbR/CyaY-like superfamily)
MNQYDPRIDQYIEKKAAFAQPILRHIRALMHSVSPLITENIKWGHPFFEYKGILANMAAFKEHCVFGFWSSTAMVDPYGVLKRPGDKDAAGNFDRITRLSDLPNDDILKDFILQGIALKDNNYKPAAKKAKEPKAAIPMPEDFAGLLGGDPKALAIFQDFSASCKREYLEWITEAKTEPTRLKRMETALEWIAEGKTRNWKYK